MAAWCKHWSIKINEEKTRAFYFSHWIRPPESLLTLNGQNIPFLNSVKYLGVIFDKKITGRHCNQGLQNIYQIIFLTKKSLSTKSKFTLH
jgi:hypothetical protein